MRFLIIVIIISLAQFSYAQNFDIDKQYNQAMKNAKIAFEAEQYSEAVMFYREAMSLKPDKLLPKYKIEDIRTIYIKNELDKIDKVSENSSKHKNKKQQAEEQNIIKTKAEEEATKKMNSDADELVRELKTTPVSVVEITETTSDIDIDDDLNINNIERDKHSVSKIETKKAVSVVSDTDNNEETNELTIKEREVVKGQQNKKIEIIEEEPIVKEPKKVIPKPKVVVTNNEPVKNKIDIEKEKKILAEKYPNKKTVEKIEKPGKHITRVIMNIDNNVTTYLRVKYDWGATYFFIDEVGQPLKSINEQYFNLMTNLETYGY